MDEAIKAEPPGEPVLPDASHPRSPSGGAAPQRLRAVSPTEPARTCRRRGVPTEPLLGVTGLIIALVAWEVSAKAGWVEVRYVSSPSRVFAAGREYLASDLFVRDLQASGHVFLVGFGLSVVVGIALGLLLGWLPKVGQLFSYVISVGNSSPRIAIIPVLILWFGIGAQTRIVLVFLISVFPVMLSTMAAVRSIDASLLTVARAMNASPFALLRTIVLPASVPSIVSGIRIGLGMALIGVVVSEFIVASAGIGFRMQYASTLYDTDLLFAALMVVATAGVVFSVLLERLERRFDAWRPRR